MLSPGLAWLAQCPYKQQKNKQQSEYHLPAKQKQLTCSGADPGFFLGGGALVSCSASTPINQIVFFLQNTSCIRKPQVIPLRPVPRSAPAAHTNFHIISPAAGCIQTSLKRPSFGSDKVIIHQETMTDASQQNLHLLNHQNVRYFSGDN